MARGNGESALDKPIPYIPSENAALAALRLAAYELGLIRDVWAIHNPELRELADEWSKKAYEVVRNYDGSNTNPDS